MGARWRPTPSSQSGMATVEIAIGSASLLVVVMFVLAVVSVGSTQLRVVEATRVAALAAARAETDQQARGAAQRVLPGTVVNISREADWVTVRSAHRWYPPGLAAWIEPIELTAELHTPAEATPLW